MGSAIQKLIRGDTHKDTRLIKKKKKKKVGLCISMLSVSVCVQTLTNFSMAETIFMKLGVYFLTVEPILTAFS
jgi:hypothetical protein